jgi:hypothetical protein
MGTGSFPVVKGPGRDVDHPPPSIGEVRERVELYKGELYLYLYLYTRGKEITRKTYALMTG